MRVRLLSKPVAPPWNDASKNLARTLLTHARTHEYRFWGSTASAALASSRVHCEAIYPDGGAFEPGLRQNLRPLASLLAPDRRIDVYHYLFTPNPRTSHVLRVLAALKRKRSVHTLCSAPRDRRHARLLFSDAVVAMCAATARELAAQGVPRVEVIRPGVEDLPVSDARTRAARADLQADERPLVTFSGDYEYSRAHDVILDAAPHWIAAVPDLLVAFACRHKTPAARAIEASVAARIAREGLASHVVLRGDVPDMRALLAASDVVVFPVQSLHHKMDVPLTLLEAMLLGRPVVVSDLPPLRELEPDRTGASVPPGDSLALAHAVGTLLASSDRRAEAGEAGRRLVLDRFSAEEMACSYESLYERL